MSHEEVHIVSPAHFAQVVLTKHNSSLRNEVGQVFVEDPSQEGFYKLCQSLGHLLASFLRQGNWRTEVHSEALSEVCQVLNDVQAAQGFDAKQMAKLLDMAAANLDFCVDVVPIEDDASEVVLSNGQRALMELQGKLRNPSDGLRQYLLAHRAQ